MEEVIAELQANPAPSACLVMDNCQVHDRIQLPLRLGEVGFNFKFLPPYSPMLNPIEEVIGDVKREIRKLLSVDLLQEVLSIQSLPWGEKTAARRKLLHKALERAINSITPEMVDRHFQHSNALLGQAIEKQHL